MKASRWSKTRWALIIWSGLVLAWIVVDVGRILAKSCSDGDIIDEAFEGKADCASIYVNGKSSVAIDHALQRLVIGLIGAGVIGLVWLVTRDRKRVCPHCGENVEKGLTACKSCGYDFVQAASAAHGSTPTPTASAAPAGWYDDSTRPGHKRWWDGSAWGMTDDEYPAAATESGRADDATFSLPAGSTVEPEREPAAVVAVAVPSLPAATTADPPPAPEPEPASPPTRFCENCGAERRPGGNFCTSCGHA